jgi:hypothetical protein
MEDVTSARGRSATVPGKACVSGLVDTTGSGVRLDRAHGAGSIARRDRAGTRSFTIVGCVFSRHGVDGIYRIVANACLLDHHGERRGGHFGDERTPAARADPIGSSAISRAIASKAIARLPANYRCYRPHYLPAGVQWSSRKRLQLPLGTGKDAPLSRSSSCLGCWKTRQK